MADDPGLTFHPASGPFFSVLVAAYNHSAYIQDALESVARQRWADYELIVVDDGSTDDTVSKASDWIEKFRRRSPNRADLVRIANGGQSAALERGFEECRGSFICLLDSDDRWLPEKLEEVHRAALASPTVGMIVHPLHVIDSNGGRTGDVRPKRARLSDGDCRERLQRTARNVAPSTSGVTIRSDLFRQLLPMPTKRFSFGADAYLTFGAALLAPVCALPIPLAEYRVHPGGQYIRRMLSADGLMRSLEFQRCIVAHFELEPVMRRNSFFMRNVFALAKLQGTFPSQFTAYRDLIRATAADGAFSPVTRIALMGYWSICLIVPERAFRRLWMLFQSRQTGLSDEAQ